MFLKIVDVGRIRVVSNAGSGLSKVLLIGVLRWGVVFKLTGETNSVYD